MADIDYTAARIDSRDLADRLDDLDSRFSADGDLSDDEVGERAMLRALQMDTEGYAGDSWRDGVFFIADWDFTSYAQELADDIGAIDGNAGWPLYCIDWDRAARDLQMDYTSCEIEGRTYWYR